MSTKLRVIKNAIASLGVKGVKVLEQLFLIPFFIFYWGVEYYGEWLTLMIIPSVFAFSDLGLGTAAASSFVLKYAEGKNQEAVDILKTGYLIITKIIIISFFIVFSIVYFLVNFNILSSISLTEEEIIYSVFFMMLATFINFYMQLYEANYRAVRKSHIAINLQAVSGLFRLGGGLLSLYNGYGVIGFSIVQLIISIFNNFLYGYISFNVIHLNNYTGVYSKEIAKDIFKKGMGYILNPLWQVILFQGTTVVVRIILGPSAVVVFNTLRTLSRSINQIYSIIGSSIFPEIQVAIGEGKIHKAEALLKKGIKLSLILGVLGVLVLATIGMPIYNLWTNNQLIAPYSLWFILILSTFFNAIWWTSAVIFRALNRPYKLALSGLFLSIISIIFTYIFCYLFNINGAGIGMLFFEVLMALYILPSSFKLLKEVRACQ